MREKNNHLCETSDYFFYLCYNIFIDINNYFMSQKEKIYIALSLCLIAVLIFTDIVLYSYYAQLKNSPQSKIDTREVYKQYVQGLE